MCLRADWKQKKSKRSQAVSLDSYSGLAVVAVRCLCELLVAMTHFNFHNNILVALAPLLNDPNKTVGVRELVSSRRVSSRLTRLPPLRCRTCAAAPSPNCFAKTRSADPRSPVCESSRVWSNVSTTTSNPRWGNPNTKVYI